MIDENGILAIAKAAIENEGKAIINLQKHIDTNFIQIINAIHGCNGRLVISGIGKSAIIAQKIVATLNSTGTPSLFMHAADAIHGDLGMVQKDDIVLIISQSGESPEIKVLTSLLKNFGNITIAMTGNSGSFLATNTHYLMPSTIEKEACPNNLAPTTSTTLQMVIGDVLAVCLMSINNFKKEHFAKYHPGGALGKKLYLTAQDLCSKNAKPVVATTTNGKDVVLAISASRLGLVVVCNNNNEILGVVTDGDLRRTMEKDVVLSQLTAADMMTTNVKTVQLETLAVDVLALMRTHDITQVVVLNQKQYAGVVHIHDIINEGIL